MGITRRKAGGSGAAAVDVSSQEYQQLALTLGEKELEIRKLTEEKSEYKRKYEDLYSSVLKALADGVGRGAPPPAAAAASGARAQDNKDKKDGLQDKNFPLKVHRRLSKPVVADSSGKIHEKVEDPSDRKNRLKREAYHRNKRIRAELMEKAGVAVAASGARRTDDKRDDRRDDEDKDDDDDDSERGRGRGRRRRRKAGRRRRRRRRRTTSGTTTTTTTMRAAARMWPAWYYLTGIVPLARARTLLNEFAVRARSCPRSLV